MPPDSDLVALLRARRCALDGSARNLREAAGLSLRDAASAAGLNISTLSRWERAIAKPHGRPAIRYGRLLGELETLGEQASA